MMLNKPLKTMFLLLVSVTIILFSYYILAIKNDAHSSAKNDILTDFMALYNAEECKNPCWNGIEVGVTQAQDVENTLNSRNVDYRADPRGVTINLYLDNESLIWKNVEQQLGDITIISGVVHAIDFQLDLCATTVIDAFGTPLISYREDSVYPGIFYISFWYVDHGLIFSADTDTRRIRWVILRDIEQIREEFPTLDQRSWEEIAHEFPNDCIDILSEAQ